MNDEQHAQALRRQVLGDVYVTQSAADRDPFFAAFQDYALRNVFGTVWGGGALSLRELTLLNIGVLAALGKTDEVELYVRAGLLRTGLSLADLQQVLMHVAVYCGAPAGRQAFLAARRVLVQEGIDPSGLDGAAAVRPAPG